jgi:hypothetical protein
MAQLCPAQRRTHTVPSTRPYPSSPTTHVSPHVLDAAMATPTKFELWAANGNERIRAGANMKQCRLHPVDNERKQDSGVQATVSD